MLTSIGAIFDRSQIPGALPGRKQTVLVHETSWTKLRSDVFDEASSGWIFAREKLLRRIHHIKQLDHAYHDRHPPCRGNYRHEPMCPLAQTWPSGWARTKGKILTPHVLSQFMKHQRHNAIDLGDERLFVKPEIAHWKEKMNKSKKRWNRNR